MQSHYCGPKSNIYINSKILNKSSSSSKLRTNSKFENLRGKTMASKSSMKGFYKQKKKSGGITKPSKSKSTKPKNAAAIVSNVTQPSALISHGSLDLQDIYDQSEEVLRQFDMNMVYGPCLGMSRLDRWERAKKLGLNPPTDVEHLLRSRKVRNESLWDGRV